MVCLNALTRHLQPQAIQARERAQIRAIKDSMRHVEIFQMDGVAISIIERPRPLPQHDTPNPAHNTYTLKCEEPPKGAYPFGNIAGIHDTLAYINEMMDLEGLELHQDGESYPNDYFESPHYDFISRCDGDE